MNYRDATSKFIIKKPDSNFLGYGLGLRTEYYETILETNPDVETEYRLKTWTSVYDAPGHYWSVRGALDAVDYYNEVDGDFDKIKLSYEWDWLEQRFSDRYYTTPHQDV